MVHRVLKTVLALMLCTLCSNEVWAQYTVQHQAPVAFERNSITELNFTVPGISQNDVQQATIYYRYDGDFAFQQEEISFRNGVFTALFEVENQSAGSIEYYLEITLMEGENIYYPAREPSDEPVQVQIMEKSEEERKKLENVDYSILSPRVDNGVTPDDALIAIALFYDLEELEEGEFRLLIDGIDVTEDADTSAFYISYVPTELRGGPHTVTVNYVTDKENYLISEWRFFMIREGESSIAGLNPNYIPDGRAELTARNQVIAGDINNAYTGRTRVAGSYGDLRYSLNTYFTTQESNRLQPQNRYGLRMEYGDWWKFDAGHVYPVMSRFTISGRRVNGINTSLHLLNENLNFQFIYGELDRSINNLYGGIEVEQVTTGTTNIDTVDTRYTLSYANRGKGTFKRKVTGGRVGLGNPEKFQIGFHALKIQDDTTSLFNVRNYNDLISNQSNLINNLNQADRQRLEDNPDLLTIDGGSLRPRDNFVAGTDFKIGFHENRIRLESEAVISALNDNIYGGPLSVERADEMGFDIEQSNADLLERLSWMIIINENMNTIPIRLTEDEEGVDRTEFFFPTSIVAANSELSFRYPVNNLRLQYRWIGPNFNSLANSTVRKDVAGFTLTDRLNLLSNRLYLTVGFESLSDNVVGNRDATTQTLTYRTNASWYPVNKDLPRVSMGFRYRTRGNGVERFNPEVPIGFENAAVQNLRIAQNGDTLTTTFPRSNHTVNFNSSITQQVSFMEMLHDISLNFYSMKTTDEVFAFGDVSSSAISSNLLTRFSEMPLRTQFGISFNNTESGSGQNTINIFGIYAGGNYLMMDNKLSLNGRIAVTTNNATSRNLGIENNSEDNFDTNPRDNYYFLGPESSLPAFSTFAFQAGAEYRVNENHAILFDANLTNVSGSGRANDRIVQLRYVFRF